VIFVKTDNSNESRKFLVFHTCKWLNE